MEITHIGHSCFKIKGKDLSLVIDPYSEKIGYKLPKLDADVLLISHQHYDHNNKEGVSGYKLLIENPGEYESKEVFITGLPTFHDNKMGEERGRNTIYSIQMDGFNLLHLGDLGHELADATLEKIGEVDVLMIPVGGHFTIDAEIAAKVISAIEPGIVIPMHYKTKDLTGISELADLEKFLDEMGSEGSVKNGEKLRISSNSDIPEDTTVYVLKMAH